MLQVESGCHLHLSCCQQAEKGFSAALAHVLAFKYKYLHASAALRYLENVIFTAYGKFLRSQDVSKAIVPCPEVFWVVQCLPVQQTGGNVDPDRDHRIFYCHILPLQGSEGFTLCISW